MLSLKRFLNANGTAYLYFLQKLVWSAYLLLPKSINLAESASEGV